MVGALVAIGGSIVTGLLGGTARQITIEAVKMAAWRLLLAFLVWVALPIVLYNVLVDYLFDIMAWAMTAVTGAERHRFCNYTNNRHGRLDRKSP
jgi:hypothetical protein